MSDINSSATEIDGVIVFSLPTYFSVEAGEALQHQVTQRFQQGHKFFVLDLQSCNVVNSQGITAILDMAMKIVDDYCGALTMANLDDTKVEVFSLVGLIPMIQHFPSVEEAVSAAKG